MRQTHKMVKHTQTIHPTNFLSVFDHFGGLALNGLKKTYVYSVTVVITVL